MIDHTDTDQALRLENADLRARLEKAEEILRAIRSGEVEAPVVDNATKPHLSTDVTARRQAEAALQASEERFRRLFENMQDGFAHCRMVLDIYNAL